MINLLASRYAKAFYDLCLKQDEVDLARNDLAKVRQLVAESAEFVEFLKNPAVSYGSAHAILESIFKGCISRGTLQFILFLKAKKRLYLLPDACQSFDGFYRKDKNILHIKITSSINLTKDEVDSLCQSLHKKFHRDIQADTLVDTKIIGGFKIQAEDAVFDYSIATQLEKFREALLAS